jgi:hypothetical protein
VKLQRLRVRNYRIHRDTAVAFADGYTVLAAPNEHGKSTLVEAMHRALFLAHRSGGHARESMDSRFGGNPEVELEFTAEGRSWRLRKVFTGGASAVCELTDVTAAKQWRSTEAEERLTQLTGRKAAGGREGEVDAAWDHLWIWQGKATADPLTTEAGRRELTRALAARADLGGGMELAAGDAGLLRAVRAAVDASWSKNRKDLLRDSDAGALAHRVETLRGQRDAAVARRGERAAEAERLQQMRAELAVVQAEAVRLAPEAVALRNEVEALRPTVDAASGLARQLDLAQQSVATFRGVLRACESAAGALADAVAAEDIAAAVEADRRTARDAAVDLAGELATAAEHAEAAAATARKQAEFLRARGELARCEGELAQRQAEATARARQRKAVLAAEDALAGALPISGKDVVAVEKASRDLATAEGRIAGAAARLVRTAGDARLTVDGEPLAVGESRHVDRPIELAHADGTRVYVQPGGGEFAALIAELDARRAALRQLLGQLGVTDVDDARARADARTRCQLDVDAAKDVLKALPDPAAELLRLPTRQQQLANLVDELAKAVGELPAGVDEPTMTTRVAAAEAAATAAHDATRAATKRAEAARTAWEHANTALAERRSARAVAAATANAAEQAAGPANDRDGRLRTLTEAVRELAMAIAAAAPLAAQLEQATDKLATATRQAAHLEGRSRELGGGIKEHEQRLGGERHEDLDATLEQLAADLARAEHAAAAARQRAEADKLLLAVLEAIQAEQRERREQPFVDACAAYLALAHGPGVRIGLAGDDQRTLGLVDRTAGGLGAFKFQELSQGGRELTALAARLAMAEVLAAEQPDRVLPLVLDDAVTNVDPERLRQVGFLLARAATRGVQVVFATCDVERAEGLRAHSVVKLARPNWDGAGPA